MIGPSCPERLESKVFQANFGGQSPLDTGDFLGLGTMGIANGSCQKIEVQDRIGDAKVIILIGLGLQKSEVLDPYPNFLEDFTGQSGFGFFADLDKTAGHREQAFAGFLGSSNE